MDHDAIAGTPSTKAVLYGANAAKALFISARSRGLIAVSSNPLGRRIGAACRLASERCFGARFPLFYSIDIDFAQPLGDEIKERAHARRQMSPARIDRLNRRLGHHIVGQ